MNSPTPRSKRWSARNVTAVLGPTNTGKTHLAIERMLGHETGVIGLPLRLLAREVYGRVAARAGADQVALVTGEEKILPERPRYWVSTVEAMPRETDAAFVAIDEVQIAGDLERGHVFTDRILNLRGSQETLLLGAATMRGIIEQLLPGVQIITRPRMSVLSYSGQKKLTRLPQRSAVVTFSADEVYAVAELIRRQRGGAAVVLGALSPRTRNKQVEIFQSGDVDFLVATDAIGMGLNLDLDHVAFAANRKFDGYQYRALTAAELGQIAGRAGRHMRDGTFGVTGRVDPFEDSLVEAIESHRFEPVRTLQWRSDALDFTSLSALKTSLDDVPGVDGLTKAPPAEDQTALEMLSRDEEIRDLARGPENVRRLWEVCRLPDYRRIAPAQHVQIIADIFRFVADGGVVPDDWIASQLRQSSHTEGDIDTLSSRIAQIRTWTFVANQPNWLGDPPHWRDATRAAEDALSDALHERLTQRFVDRRTSVLMRRLRENTMLEAEITASGDVLVEGQHVGSLQGFRFTPAAGGEGADARAVRGAAQKALATAIVDRAERLAKAPDSEIVLSFDGYLRWRGEPIARLVAGEDALKPRAVLLADEQLTGAPRELADNRVTAWIGNHVATVLKPLVDLAEDQSLTGMARGIAFRLVENLGIVDRRDVAEDVRGLDQEARASLRRHGVRFGAHHLYIPALLKPAPSTLAAQLWALKNRDFEVPGLSELSAISGSGRTSVNVEPGFEPELYRRFGFRSYGRRAVRIDILERLADLIRPALAWRPGAPGMEPAGAFPGGGFIVTPAMTSLLGASGEDMAVILKGLGYRAERRPRPEPRPAADVSSGPQPPAAEAAAEAPADATAAAPGELPEDLELAEEIAESAGEETAEPTLSDAIASGAIDVGETGAIAAEAQAEEMPAQSGPEDASAEADGVEPAVADMEAGAAPSGPEGASAQEGGAEPAASATEAAGEPAAAEPAADGEPEMIDVWRPSYGGGRDRSKRPRRDGRHHGQGRDVAGSGRPEQGRSEDGERRRQRQDNNREERADRAGGRGGQERKGQPEAHGKRQEHRGGGSRKGGGYRPERQERPRERPVDPDNPFAALAALKKQLEENGGR
ncbi:helicase-related protein [Propylenella binzhouense]|uniref:Helicase n=1 Tax=Propylenella binzhouense TaxID=2555902 RepID=A0A964T7S4_9HYPH|nr:helicase-related protein [Propylenella binzhouense]MYZ50116.1 helicase [Propylenella binzhouense]